MKWKLINDELNRVESLFKNKPFGTLFMDRYFKKDLEWWILGRFLKIVNKTKSRFPRFGLDIEKNGEPDFYISKNGKTLFKKIEITEVLKPGRKRSLEYKNKSRDANEVSNIWSSFHERLNEKFKRDFGDDCWLIIYHNIRYTDITSVGFWHNMILAYFEKTNLSKSKYEKIFVINSSGKAAVSIYPIQYIVYPELTDTSTFIGSLYIRNYNKLSEFLLNN